MTSAARSPGTRRRAPRRARDESGRRLHSAGSALVVAALALVLGLLLNAQGIYKSAYNQPDGFERDVALAFAGPVRDVSHALRLDRPRHWLKRALGREDDDTIDVVVALPPTPSTSAPAQPPPARATPRVKIAFTPTRKLRLWIAGDSLVVVPGHAIAGAAGASPVIESVGGVEGRIATGLERPDVFNWFTYIREQLKELKPGAVVLGFGGNDDHGYMTGLPEGVEVDFFGGPVWVREYRRRAGGLMDLINRAGAAVVWIGLPITSSPEQSQRFDVINAAVVAEAKERPGKVEFLDTYTMFAGDDGGYTQYLEDTAGRLQKVRAGDGVHFERAGGDMIAREALRRLNRIYDLTSWRNAPAGPAPGR
jgi:hypothetical protein